VTEKTTELMARSVGEAVKACKHDMGYQIIFELFTSTRNVSISWAAGVDTDTAYPSDAEVLETLALLAERQIAIIDQKSPPNGAMTVTTGTPPFQFSAPAALPSADDSKPYMPNGQPYSFCDPPTTGPTISCPPPGSTAMNPSGGSPPYHFQYGTLGGFPPFGLSLGKDGQLTGTPNAATTGKTYSFVVCAIDLKADYVCRNVSIAVGQQAPPATLALSPTSAAAGATVAISGQNFTAGSTLKTLTIGTTSVLPAASVTMQANGTFTVNVTVPAQLAASTYAVTATDNAGKIATTQLSVTVPQIVVTLSVKSITCSVISTRTQGSETYYTFDTAIIGDASGPVGTIVKLRSGTSSESGQWTGSGGWSVTNTGNSGIDFQRGTGQPENTSWTVHLVRELSRSFVSYFGFGSITVEAYSTTSASVPAQRDPCSLP